MNGVQIILILIFLGIVIFSLASLNIKSILDYSGLILSIINGLILVYLFLRDIPKIEVDFVHPDVYNWFVKLPSGNHEGHETNKWGFLVYLSLVNKGYRPVAVTSWRAGVILKNSKKHELKPISIPFPTIKLTEKELKVFPVLGQVSDMYKDNLYIQSGDSTAGFAYYELETWGERFEPEVTDKGIKIKIICTDAFGNKSIKSTFIKEKSLEEVNKIIPNFANITSKDFLS